MHLGVTATNLSSTFLRQNPYNLLIASLTCCGVWFLSRNIAWFLVFDLLTSYIKLSNLFQKSSKASHLDASKAYLNERNFYFFISLSRCFLLISSDEITWNFHYFIKQIYLTKDTKWVLPIPGIPSGIKIIRFLWLLSFFSTLSSTS